MKMRMSHVLAPEDPEMQSALNPAVRVLALLPKLGYKMEHTRKHLRMQELRASIRRTPPQKRRRRRNHLVPRMRLEAIVKDNEISAR